MLPEILLEERKNPIHSLCCLNPTTFHLQIELHDAEDASRAQRTLGVLS